jgi:hypothetical protein
MAWSEEVQQPALWSHFSFYASGGTNGAVTESLNPTGKQFRFNELRLHFSVAFASVEDLVVRISATKGSAHNVILLSRALLGLTDILLQLSNAYDLLSDDQVVIGWSQASGVNIGGLNVLGWGIWG